MRKSFVILATRFTLLLAGLAAAGLAGAGTLVDMQVISRSSSRPLSIYSQFGKPYVIGTPGERYSIQLTNRTNARVMGVLSVDGVNAVTGETAGSSQVGYVLNPYQVAEITGWRKSVDEVARFYFTTLPDSYAAQTDRPDNVGVIGLAVYREYVDPAAISRLDSRQNKAAREAAAPSARAESADGSVLHKDERIGTGHGEREVSVVTHTEFRKASSTPAETVAIWYDSRERLASRGILPRQPRYCADPRPFPANFVPDPRG